VSKESKNKAIVLSALEEDFLSLLHRQSLYGLEFLTAIREASNGTRDVGFGSLYPTLGRLEKQKLVSWRWGDEQTGPRRKYYEITPFGKAVLEETWRYRKALITQTIITKAEDMAPSDEELSMESAVVSLAASTRE
jgi:PadR family transcriptional regulator, regulatory protein PadR